MRIAHVVTYVSEDGAFGGPVAVAIAQVRELARAGHDVELLAGWDGVARLSIEGVRVGLFRARRIGPGLSGLFSPGLLRYLKRHGSEFDAIHIHLGRDMVTLLSASAVSSKTRKVVLQTHGMIMPDRRMRARVLDGLLTRRILAGAKQVFVLTEQERSGLTSVAGGSGVVLTTLPNGIGLSPQRRDAGSHSRQVVLFLARLHERKRVLLFAQAARIAQASGSAAIFRVVGPDEGDLAALLAYKESQHVTSLEYAGSVAPGEGVRELANADVFVLPSKGEVFPMTVLESLSVGTPVILSSDCPIAPDLAARGAVLPFDSTAESLANAIMELLADSGRRADLRDAGFKAIEEWLSIEAVARELVSAYSRDPTFGIGR